MDDLLSTVVEKLRSYHEYCTIFRSSLQMTIANGHRNLTIEFFPEGARRDILLQIGGMSYLSNSSCSIRRHLCNNRNKTCLALDTAPAQASPR